MCNAVHIALNAVLHEQALDLLDRMLAILSRSQFVAKEQHTLQHCLRSVTHTSSRASSTTVRSNAHPAVPQLFIEEPTAVTRALGYACTGNDY